MRQILPLLYCAPRFSPHSDETLVSLDRPRMVGGSTQRTVAGPRLRARCQPSWTIVRRIVQRCRRAASSHSRQRFQQSPQHARAAPHCVYCPGFAANFALGASLPAIPAPVRAFGHVRTFDRETVFVRRDLRVAQPRAPPETSIDSRSRRADRLKRTEARLHTSKHAPVRCMPSGMRASCARAATHCSRFPGLTCASFPLHCPCTDRSRSRARQRSPCRARRPKLNPDELRPMHAPPFQLNDRSRFAVDTAGHTTAAGQGRGQLNVRCLRPD